MKSICILAGTFMLAGVATAQELKFLQISTQFNNPIGIDHDEPTNSVIVSVNYATGNPVALERILQNGSHVGFSALSGVTDEVKIATVRSGAVNMGGFTAGELYVGNGLDGQIVKLSPGGGTITNPWVSLPGANNGLMRGSLYHDRTGVFGGDLIVCTTLGEVWRVTSAGAATMLASIGTHLEGLLTVPNNAAQYGPLAGKVVCGAEAQGLLYAVDTMGNVTSYDFDVDIEDIDLIPKGQNFYGVNFGTSTLLGVAASAFDSSANDLLLTEELHSGSGLYRLHWNSGSNIFEVTEFDIATGSASVGQWEHVTFSHAGINPLAAVYTGVNKDLMNATGVRADQVVISVQGTYGPGDIKSHYDGGFPTFTSTIVGGTTQFSWSGMNVPNNGVVHVGVEWFGPAVKIFSVAWAANGVGVGCARQVNSLYGTHTSGTHQVEYTNDVLSCEATTLSVGELSVEYYDNPPALAELNPNGTRSPLVVHTIPDSPEAITAGASHVVFVPDPPINATYVVLVFKVSTSPTLAPPDLTLDFVLQPLEPQSSGGPPPQTYCTAGTSASGCQALLSGTGVPSATAPSGFSLTASTVEGQKDGLFFFGTNGQQANPWGNGTSFQCVVPPVKRTGVINGTGTIGNCDGQATRDMNALWTAQPQKNPGAGSTVQAQFWYRDPGNTSNQKTSLSDAIEFTVGN